MSILNMLVAAFIMALVTYIPRAVPLVAFRGQIKSPFVRSFLYYIPYAVLAAMTFPAILYSTDSVPHAAIGLLGAIITSLLGLGLLPVAIVAVLCSLLSQLFI